MTPIARGVTLALAAALAFGATTPLVQRFAQGASPPATAALLYLGASCFAALGLGRGQEQRIRRADAPRLLGVGLFGAFLAPVALVAGLAKTSGTTASLLLNLEAVFTVLLGVWVYREPLARRVIFAVLFIAGGGALVALEGKHSGPGGSGFGGPLLVTAATLCWALDNTLSRPLSDLDSGEVVMAKGAIGAAMSGGLALGLGLDWPALGPALGVMLCGALGYGASLRLYLRAQRVLGAARTGSVFAVAPFLGMVGALALGEPLGGWFVLTGGVLMALGVWLHLGERHDHAHVHPPLTHTHPHRHDDGHHDDHRHDPPVLGEHSHEHTHLERAHSHAHGEDLHHRHGHGSMA